MITIDKSVKCAYLAYNTLVKWVAKSSAICTSVPSVTVTALKFFQHREHFVPQSFTEDFYRYFTKLKVLYCCVLNI